MAIVVDLLRRAVDREPDRTAISFSGAAAPAGHGGSLDLTNAQLYSRVGRIAPLLRRDTRVLVLLPAGPDFFAALFAAFHAGATAVPTPPPANDSDRFVSVAVDCTADAIVTTAETAATARRIWDRSGAPPIRWILVDDLDHAEGSSREGFVAPDSLAVLQYTSGSTGRPKGVAISHEVLTAWLDVFVERVALPPGSTVVTWAPVHHALGLAVALMALPMGGRTSLLAPEDVLADPVRWLRAISATPTPVYSGAPPFAYQLCVDATEPGDRQGLDLSRWEVALIGSERIRPQILDRFAAAFGPHGFALSAFFPSYGMTEIMMASGHRGPAEPVRLTVDAAALERREVRITPDADRTVDLVASGAPGVGIDLVIVDPDTRRPCADGQVGELWVRGPVVAGGYWRRPEQTAETFGQQLADGTGPYLRTGDLAFFHQGELVVCGRLSELVIIRGRNLLPQDIESTVQAADPALAGRPTAAFSVEGDDVDHLVVVADTEPESVPEPDRLAERVRRAVTAAHDVEVDAVLLVPTGQMPQTGTGKVQRAACRRAYQDGAFTPFGTARLSVAAPATTDVDTAPPLRGLLAALPAHLRQPVAEAELRRRVSVLTGVPVDEVAPDSPLIDLGLDSLRMIKLRGLLAADGQLDKPLVEQAARRSPSYAAQLGGTGTSGAARGGPGRRRTGRAGTRDPGGARGRGPVRALSADRRPARLPHGQFRRLPAQRRQHPLLHRVRRPGTGRAQVVRGAVPTGPPARHAARGRVAGRDTTCAARGASRANAAGRPAYRRPRARRRAPRPHPGRDVPPDLPGGRVAATGRTGQHAARRGHPGARQRGPARGRPVELAHPVPRLACALRTPGRRPAAPGHLLPAVPVGRQARRERGGPRLLVEPAGLPAARAGPATAAAARRHGNPPVPPPGRPAGAGAVGHPARTGHRAWPHAGLGAAGRVRGGVGLVEPAVPVHPQPADLQPQAGPPGHRGGHR
ncbi:AMP-binding protein [Salinispora arenicola]|nr:AMP-binding protein [Salinispora arenicola]